MTRSRCDSDATDLAMCFVENLLFEIRRDSRSKVNSSASFSFKIYHIRYRFINLFCLHNMFKLDTIGKLISSEIMYKY